VTNSEELWVIHIGRALVHVLDSDGVHHVQRLGTDLAAGERPVVVVPADYWQAAEVSEATPFAFGANICAPPFSYEGFVMGQRQELLHQFPQHADLITRLTLEA